MSRADHTRGAAALAAREAQVEPSRPEPPPVDRGVPVTPPLVEWLRGRGLEDTARLVEARDAFGREKYGQPLMSLDGRDPIEDARQELGDALQYVQRALMVGADLRPLREPLRALVGLLAKGRQSGNVGALAAVLAAPDDGRVGVPPSAPEWADLECTCQRCNPPRLMGGWLVVCATCGNKRCPHATDCRNACTGSNEPGQPGSVYGRVGGDAEMPADAVDDGRGTVTPEDDPRFVHLVLAGTATERDFEEAVDQWHMGYGDNGEELHEYLRLTRDEYAVIVTDGQRGIERVIAGRRADAQGAK